MRMCFPLLLATLCLQATPPALSARIRYTQRLETPDGLSKTTTFEERMVRSEDRVWQERVLKVATEGNPSEEHLHPQDLAIAARYLQREPSGALHLEFIHDHRVRIHAEPRDYPEVGFDGSWATAYHFLDPTRLNAMKPLAKKAPLGARWYGQADQTQFLRVLWSPRLELPLRIEAGTLDGRKLNLTEIRPSSLPKVLPWDHLEALQEKDYTDLLD